MREHAHIGVSFGALCDPLHVQLGVVEALLAREQEHADRITHLRIGGILTDRESHNARKRLLKRIVKKVVEVRNDE